MYYRILIDVTTATGDFIESGSLFIRKGDTMELVDDDRYVALPYDELYFKPI